MPLKLVNPPTEEPISLDEAKLHLRVEFDFLDDDPLITGLISAARQYAETETHRSLCQQSWKLVLDAFPCPTMTNAPFGKSFSLPSNAVILERCPIISVDSIRYLDMAGVWQTMPTADYVVDLASEPARITPVFGKIWPIPMPQIASVEISFTAGYGAASDVPEGIKIWMKVRLAALYENREEVALMNRGKIEPLPYVDILLDGYRVEVM